MSIYCWTIGELALARISKRVYAKVRVVKNEDGIFFDDKVLGMSSNDDGTATITEELCYYVEIIRTKETLWLPYTSLHLAPRSRPFYGTDKPPPPPVKQTVSKKRKPKEDITLPMQAVKHAKFKATPDLTTTFELRQLPMKMSKFENAFKEFIRRGKDMIFDEFYFLLSKDPDRLDDWDYITNVNASTEDKFETVIKNCMTEKEVKNYLKCCWRYNFVQKEIDNSSVENASENSTSSSPTKQPTIHINWCLVCGKRDDLIACSSCPACFHAACLPLWVSTVMHRKSPPKNVPKDNIGIKTTIHKILSSTRTITTTEKIDTELPEICPSCLWGPNIGYGDVVWHKLNLCPWWPAKVLDPGSLPSCLVARKHNPQQWPVQYYGDHKYSWCDAAKMCLFLPSHTSALNERRSEDLKEAVLEACDDYISVYLT